MTNASDENMQQTEVAVLISQFKEMGHTLVDIRNELKTLSAGQHDILVKLPVIEEKLANHTQNVKELKARVTELESEVDTMGRSVDTHARIWKIVGTSLIISCGVITYSWKQLDEFKSVMAALDRRITLIEYQVTETNSGQ